jgi:hypothetical protein
MTPPGLIAPRHLFILSCMSRASAGKRINHYQWLVFCIKSARENTCKKIKTNDTIHIDFFCQAGKYMTAASQVSITELLF